MVNKKVISNDIEILFLFIVLCNHLLHYQLAKHNAPYLKKIN